MIPVERLELAAAADADASGRAGLRFTWTQILTGKREAEIDGLDDNVRLEWVHDSAFRFFPARRDELFGYVLHSAVHFRLMCIRIGRYLLVRRAVRTGKRQGNATHPSKPDEGFIEVLLRRLR